MPTVTAVNTQAGPPSWRSTLSSNYKSLPSLQLRYWAIEILHIRTYGCLAFIHTNQRDYFWNYIPWNIFDIFYTHSGSSVTLAEFYMITMVKQIILSFNKFHFWRFHYFYFYQLPVSPTLFQFVKYSEGLRMNKVGVCWAARHDQGIHKK